MVITEAILGELKEEFKKHEDNPDAVFEFKGQPYLVSYARYLIVYLEQEFRSVKRQENSGTKEHSRTH